MTHVPGRIAERNTNKTKTKGNDMNTVNQVKMTNDYDLFSHLLGNRIINKPHKERLKKSIGEDYIPVPIVVNESYQIIDGQHRYESAKELGKPIYFIQIDGLKLNEVHRLNTNSKNWTAEEYMIGYCELKYPEYLKYRDFKNQYGFGHNETMAILKGASRNGGTETRQFRHGNFKILDLNESVRIAEKIKMVGEYYPGYKRRAFVYTMLDMFCHPKYNHAEFLNKLSFQSVKMQDCTDVQGYKTLIEEIYNFKRSRSDKVRLF